MIALSCNSSLLKRTEAEGSRVHQPELPKKRKMGEWEWEGGSTSGYAALSRFLLLKKHP